MSEDFRWSEVAEGRARAAVAELAERAETFPEFLVNELPPETSHDELEKQIAALAPLSVRMTTIQRADLIEKFIVRFPSLPRRPARKLFTQAVVVAQLAAAKAAEASGEPLAAGDGAAAGRAEGTATPGSKVGRAHGQVREHPRGYYERDSGEDFERISAFRLQVVARIAHENGGPDWLQVHVFGIDKGDPGAGWDAPSAPVLARHWTIPPSAWNGTRNFLAAFPNDQMSWMGSDANVQGLHALLVASDAYEQAPRVLSTRVLGRYTMADGSPRFVMPAGTMGPGGRWMKNADLVYLPDGGSNLQHRLPTEQADLDDPDTLQLARDFLKDVLCLHEPERVGAVTCWMVATLFGPFIRSKLGSFPILNVYATAGSGKTSLLKEIFWPAFSGVKHGELLSCTSSLFSYTRDFSAANAIALILDEFRQGDMNKAGEMLLRLIRRVYSGDTETRGRADQGVNIYLLIGLLVLMGETRLGEGDQAVLERCVFVGMDANWLPRHPADEARFMGLKDRPLWKIAAILQSWSLRADPDAILARARALLDSVLAKLGRTTIPSRVRLNMLVVVFGAVAFDELARDLGVATPSVSVVSMIGKLLDESLDEDSSGMPGKRTRDFFDELYCAGALMANLGIIKENREYVWIDKRLCINVPAVEAAHNKWRKDQGLHGVSPGARAYKRIAQERLASGESYITAVGRRAPFDGEDGARRVRCVEVDPSRVPESLQAEEYPCGEMKMHGGAKQPTAQEIMERFRRAGSN